MKNEGRYNKAWSNLFAYQLDKAGRVRVAAREKTKRNGCHLTVTPRLVQADEQACAPLK